MYSTYTNLVKSAKEVFCDIDWTLKFRRPNIRCHIAERTLKSSLNRKKTTQVFVKASCRAIALADTSGIEKGPY